MTKIAIEKQWDTSTRHRLEAVTEEAVLILLEQKQHSPYPQEDSLTDRDLRDIKTIGKGEYTNFMEKNEAEKNESVSGEYEYPDVNDISSAGERRLHVIITASYPSAVLEFISAPSKAENLEDRLAILRENDEEISEISIERDVTLRLLRHYSKSVTHRQYQEAEIISAVVEVTADS